MRKVPTGRPEDRSTRIEGLLVRPVPTGRSEVRRSRTIGLLVRTVPTRSRSVAQRENSENLPREAFPQEVEGFL